MSFQSHGVHFRRLTYAALVAVFVTAEGCDSENSNSLTDPRTPLEPGTVTGIVRIDGLPAGGTLVALSGSGHNATAVSGKDGGFRFIDVPPGPYSLGATPSLDDGAGATDIECPSVSVTLQASGTVTANIACTGPPGAITGTVTSSGALLGGAKISLSDRVRTGEDAVQAEAITNANGSFTIDDLPRGSYLVTVETSMGIECPVLTLGVQPNRITTANFACTAPSGTIAARVFDADLGSFGLPRATVTVSGPTSRSTTTPSEGFVHNLLIPRLPPGDYTVTVTMSVSREIVWHCETATAEVQAGQTTSVEVECRYHPPLAEIGGTWFYYYQAPAQEGASCPTPLPSPTTFSLSGPIMVEAATRTVAMQGLDPELTIVGTYDPASGRYRGTGTAVLSDGSSITTGMTASFGFYVFEIDSGFVFDGVMIRQHRNPGGDLVCSETYDTHGFRE